MSENIPNYEDFHVGNMIITWLKINNLPQAHLARLLGMPTSNLNRLLKRKSMYTDMLLQISVKLGHNFFADICGEEEPDEGFILTDAPIGKHIENRLKELKMTQTKFASLLGVTSAEISRMVRNTSFDVLKLLKISRLLDYNFFQDFYKINDPDEAENNSLTAWIRRYEHLVIENNMLQSEVTLLKERIKSQQSQIGKLEKDLGIKFDTSLNGPLVKIDYPISSELLEKLKVIAEHYNIDFQTFMDLAFNRSIEMLADKYESTGTVEDLIR